MDVDRGIRVAVDTGDVTLGCTVNWGGDTAHPDQFFCPCHQGRYTQNGGNIAGTPPLGPLDEFEVSEKDGFLMIGNTVANRLV